MNDIIIQARMGSKRLPGKVLMDVCGDTILGHICERAKASKKSDRIIVATSTRSDDKKILSFCKARGIACFAGDENNVLKRYHDCVDRYESDVIMRLTGDNALIDHDIIDKAFDYFASNNYDYVFYRLGLPIGIGVEIFTKDALNKAYEEAEDEKSKEHVTYYMYTSGKFNIKRVESSGENHSHMRLTMDTLEDYKVVRNIYERLYPVNKDFLIDDIYHLIDGEPTIIDGNKDIEQRK